QKNIQTTPKLLAVNISSEDKIYQDEFNLQDDLTATISLPLNYLYEPFSSYLKVGGYNAIANKFNTLKLHKHSHLYTSESLVDFPGRTFKIQEVISYSKKEMKVLENTKANITIRNFPL